MKKQTDDETMKLLIKLVYEWLVQYDVTCVKCNVWMYLDPMTDRWMKIGRSWLTKMLLEDIQGLNEHDCFWCLNGCEWAVSHHGPIEGLKVCKLN